MRTGENIPDYSSIVSLSYAGSSLGILVRSGDKSIFLFNSLFLLAEFSTFSTLLLLRFKVFIGLYEFLFDVVIEAKSFSG